MLDRKDHSLPILFVDLLVIGAGVVMPSNAQLLGTTLIVLGSAGLVAWALWRFWPSAASKTRDATTAPGAGISVSMGDHNRVGDIGHRVHDAPGLNESSPDERRQEDR